MSPKIENATRTYTVVDRAAMSRDQVNRYHVITTTVIVSNRCPVCGGERGQAVSQWHYDDGDTYVADGWKNACGHVDMYDAILIEAASFNLDAHLSELNARTLERSIGYRPRHFPTAVATL